MRQPRSAHDPLVPLDLIFPGFGSASVSVSRLPNSAGRSTGVMVATLNVPGDRGVHPPCGGCRTVSPAAADPARRGGPRRSGDGGCRDETSIKRAERWGIS